VVGYTENMKYTLKKARKFSWEGLKGWAYNSKEDFKNASGAYIEVTGKHGKIKTLKSDRVYYVINGVGEFIINDEVIPIEKSDVVIVPSNVIYNYRAKEGKLKLFLVHTPAFDQDSEVSLE